MTLHSERTATNPTRPPGARECLGAGAIVAFIAAAAAVRLLVFALHPPVALVGDEIYYAQVAHNLRTGNGHVYVEDRRTGPGATRLHAWRPPGQAFWLAAAAAPDARASAEAPRVGPAEPGPGPTRVEDVRGMVALQIAAGSLLVGAIAAFGSLALGRRGGALAGTMAVCSPTLVSFSHYLWSETLCALLLATALVLALRRPASASARGGFGHAAAVGVLLGAGTLVREVALPAAAVIGLWWWRESPAASPARARARRHALVVVALALACVSPWTLRNARVLGAFVPVSTIGWFAAGLGNTFEADDWLRPDGPAHTAFRRAYFSIDDELARSEFARRWTLEQIASAQPAWALRKLVREGSALLSPDNYLLFKHRVGAYGPGSEALEHTLLAASVALHIGTSALAALGFAFAAPPLRRLSGGLLALPCAVHLVANAASRFRVPWLAVVFVLAARGAAVLADARERREIGRRLATPAGLAALAVLGFVVCVALPWTLVYGGRR